MTKLLVMAGGLLAAGAVLRELGGVPGTAWVDASIRDEGFGGELVFVLVGAALTAAGAPRQTVAFLGGYAFGTVLGVAFALLAQLLGCAASFGWARAVARGWAERRMAGRFGHRLRPVRDAVSAAPFGATLALRLLPVGNNLALNLLGGAAGVAFGPFLAASALGYLPQTVVFALLGKGIRVEGAWQLGLAGVLLVASLGLGVWLLRRHRDLLATADREGDSTSARG